MLRTVRSGVLSVALPTAVLLGSDEAVEGCGHIVVVVEGSALLFAARVVGPRRECLSLVRECVSGGR